MTLEVVWSGGELLPARDERPGPLATLTWDAHKRQAKAKRRPKPDRMLVIRCAVCRNAMLRWASRIRQMERDGNRPVCSAKCRAALMWQGRKGPQRRAK